MAPVAFGLWMVDPMELHGSTPFLYPWMEERRWKYAFADFEYQLQVFAGDSISSLLNSDMSFCCCQKHRFLFLGFIGWFQLVTQRSTLKDHQCG